MAIYCMCNDVGSVLCLKIDERRNNVGIINRRFEKKFEKKI